MRRPPTRRQPGRAPACPVAADVVGRAVRAPADVAAEPLDDRDHHPRLRRPAGRQGGHRPVRGGRRGARLRPSPLVDTESDNAAINGEITTAVAQGVDAIVTAFGTPQEFGEGLADAAEAGVPVFGLDTGGVVEPTLVNVTTDTGFLGEAVARRPSSTPSASAAQWR